MSVINNKAGRKMRSEIRARIKTTEVKKPKFELGVNEPIIKQRNADTNTNVVQKRAEPVCE